jgi:hypothetical protein
MVKNRHGFNTSTCAVLAMCLCVCLWLCVCGAFLQRGDDSLGAGGEGLGQRGLGSAEE